VHGEDLSQVIGIIGERDVVKDASPEESRGQRLLLVVGDEDQRSQIRPFGRDRELHPGCLGDLERELVELVEKVIGEVDVGLVDLVDEDN
jgi:hypothetical protein